MNRQTLAVTLGTLALVVIGAILLYATPSPQGTRVDHPAQKAAKGKPGAKGKDQASRKVPEEKLVHATPIPASRPAAPAGAPNVVLVLASTQRKDQWSVYGAPKNVTPYLAARAAEGVVMGDALAVAVDPRAADPAILSGRYPHNAGVIEASQRKNNRAVPAAVTTIAERFAEAGWFTVGLSANHHLNARAGSAQGFDWYRDSQPFSLMTEHRIDASELVRKALERVVARTEIERTRPLYLQLAFVDSHKPIKVPPNEFEPLKGDGGADIAPYRATIRRIDDAIQRLVEGLSSQGVTPANTIFVVMGDHGEGLELPPHHRKQHGFVLYRSSVSIPWVLWGKGLPKGREVKGLASAIDLAPTLVSLAGLGGQQGFDGLDLSAAVLGNTPTTGRDRAYADTLWEGMHRASIWTTARQCQKDYGTTKQVEDDVFETACYDRVADPDFTKPLADEALMRELDELHDELLAAAKAAPSGPRVEEEEGDVEEAE